MRRLAVLLVLGGISCRSQAPAPVPQSLDASVSAFLDAVQANDLTRMGALWGTERGPAGSWMDATQLKKRLTVIQHYLSHDGYRILEGPLPVADHEDERSFHVELERGTCNVVLPIDVVRAHSGSWLVYDVHLEALSAPSATCPPGRGGTAP